ncbi:MAG TPA: GIY-YIG nuclease family protein [Bacteroidales bacterium]|nr:GIY-YIG nuclease family protein [Bacteroidales bacterium]
MFFIKNISIHKLFINLHNNTGSVVQWIPACRQAGNIRFLSMFYVYILYSDKFNRFYTGFTKDIKQRLKEHNSGQTKSTKPYRPWQLIYQEVCKTRMEARKREKYYKSGTGREKIKDIKQIQRKDF